MLCIQSDMTDEETFKKLSQKLRVVVEAAVGKGMSVGYVEAIPGSDRRMFDALGGLIPEENFVPFVHVWNDGSLACAPGQVLVHITVPPPHGGRRLRGNRRGHRSYG